MYGTLRDPLVREKVFGRVVGGSPDQLCEYARQEMKIEGETYPALIPAGDNCVNGLVLDLSEGELGLADKYETEAYERIKVLLKSGNESWTYVKRRSEF